VVAAAIAIAIGDTLTHFLDATGVLASLGAGALVGGLTMVVHVLGMSVMDRTGVQELRDRGRRRRQKESQQ
jgi:putative peptidoglycan lipid II flippase